MFLSIEPSGGVAIYEQIVWQIKCAIAEQTLRPGQLLPSVRALSHQLAINPTTVARAYFQLQSEGILESLRGRGMIVSDRAVPECRSFRQDLFADRIGMVLGEALHGGLSSEEIRKIVDKKLSQLNGTIVKISDPIATKNSEGTK
jgi:GntR family transcriptional regulator